MRDEIKATAKSEFVSGARAQLPLMLGVVPFGLIYGAVAVQVHIPALVAQAMSSVIFAGSSQFIAAPLIAASAPGVVIVITVFVVNLRHALYSASVAPHLERISPLWKVVLTYLLTDEAYAVGIAHYNESGEHEFKHWYLFGTGFTLWLFWQTSTAVGIFVGAQIPAGWSLNFALPLTFIAIVVPMLKSRAMVVSALVAGLVGVLAASLPYKLGLILAALMGISAGLIADGMFGERRDGGEQGDLVRISGALEEKS